MVAVVVGRKCARPPPLSLLSRLTRCRWWPTLTALRLAESALHTAALVLTVLAVALGLNDGRDAAVGQILAATSRSPLPALSTATAFGRESPFQSYECRRICADLPAGRTTPLGNGSFFGAATAPVPLWLSFLPPAVTSSVRTRPLLRFSDVARSDNHCTLRCGSVTAFIDYLERNSTGPSGRNSTGLIDVVQLVCADGAPPTRENVNRARRRLAALGFSATLHWLGVHRCGMDSALLAALFHRVSVLDLRGNALTTLRWTAIPTDARVDLLDVRDNALDCRKCENGWIRRLLPSKSVLRRVVNDEQQLEDHWDLHVIFPQLPRYALVDSAFAEAATAACCVVPSRRPVFFEERRVNATLGRPFQLRCHVEAGADSATPFEWPLHADLPSTREDDAAENSNDTSSVVWSGDVATLHIAEARSNHLGVVVCKCSACDSPAFSLAEIRFATNLTAKFSDSADYAQDSGRTGINGDGGGGSAVEATTTTQRSTQQRHLIVHGYPLDGLTLSVTRRTSTTGDGNRTETRRLDESEMTSFFDDSLLVRFERDHSYFFLKYYTVFVHECADCAHVLPADADYRFGVCAVAASNDFEPTTGGRGGRCSRSLSARFGTAHYHRTSLAVNTVGTGARPSLASLSALAYGLLFAVILLAVGLLLCALTGLGRRAVAKTLGAHRVLSARSSLYGGGDVDAPSRSSTGTAAANVIDGVGEDGSARTSSILSVGADGGMITPPEVLVKRGRRVGRKLLLPRLFLDAIRCGALALADALYARRRRRSTSAAALGGVGANRLPTSGGKRRAATLADRWELKRRRASRNTNRTEETSIPLEDTLSHRTALSSSFSASYCGGQYASQYVPVIDARELVLKDRIGRGAFGEVFTAEWRSSACASTAHNRLVAVKMLHGAHHMSAEMEKEAALLARLDHPNVLRLYGISLQSGSGGTSSRCDSVDENGAGGMSTASTQTTTLLSSSGGGGGRPTVARVALVLELMNQGDLKTYLRRREPRCDNYSQFPAALLSTELIDICVQICTGLCYLASQQIVHRDLAARNCLVAGESDLKICSAAFRPPITVKISDFGMSRRLYSDSEYYRMHDKQQALPVRWLPPECLTFGKFTHQSDMWSFAVTLFEVFTYGEMPFGQLSNTEVLTAVASGRLQPEVPAKCPPAVADLMRQCWTEEPTRRPTAPDALSRLKTIQ